MHNFERKNWEIIINNKTYTQKLNIQQHSIYKITTVNIHKQISFSPRQDSNPRPPAVRHESQVCYNSATQSPQFELFDVSFPEKLLKIVATRGEIFSLKFTEYRLAAGLRPDTLGELKRSPRLHSRNRGPTSKGRGRERKGGRGGKGRGLTLTLTLTLTLREGRRGGREGKGGGRGGEGKGAGAPHMTCLHDAPA